MDNPLTKKDLSDIKEALYKLAQVVPLVELLEKLGQDVGEIRERIEFYRHVLTTIRTELFPDTP